MTRAAPPLRVAGITPPRSARGAAVASQWIPHDVWLRLAHAMKDLRSQQVFARVCGAAAAALREVRAPAEARVRHRFRVAAFALPEALAENVLMVHAVPSGGAGVLVFVDESHAGGGVELAWLACGIVRRVPLGLEAVPATAVSNIRFAPDGRSVALLVTLAHGSRVAAADDPLRRLRGWGEAKDERGEGVDVDYDPCEDCTVQVVDLQQDDEGAPLALLVHTFSHVFVPEYGFDMVWRVVGVEAAHEKGRQELAFAAMLHSDAGAATYLVRWKTLRDPAASNFIFMACVEGASTELVADKKNAMMTVPTTLCTSRIEIANDAKHIFFDTVSKFGILRFDQTENARHSNVTRADLPNNLVAQLRKLSVSTRHPSLSLDCYNCCEADRKRAERLGKSFHSIETACKELSRAGLLSDSTRVSRMSPDGSLLCSVVSTHHSVSFAGSLALPPRQVEMRSSLTGHLMYRRLLVQHCEPRLTRGALRLRLEKSGDVAHHTMGFSDDSSVVLIWDTLLTKTHCIVVQRLPVVLDSRTGGVIQDFGPFLQQERYECLQMSSDARTIYGTKMRSDMITMDAVDVLTGNILKTVVVTGPVRPPKLFSVHAIYLLPNGQLRTVTGEYVNGLWDTTRGSLGCGWRRAGIMRQDNDDHMIELQATETI